jgi:hypothetical protein
MYSLGAHGGTRIACQPGEVFTASVWVRSAQAGYKAQVSINPYDLTPSAIGGISSAYVSLTAGEWTRISITATIPANGFSFYFMCNVNTQSGGAGTIGHYANVDDALIERSPVVGDVFSGSSSGAGWFGAANQSPSFMYTSITEQQVLSNSGKYDGLTINGTVASFATEYLTSGQCKASYDMQVLRNVLITGVHTADKNQLYIDGVLVAEANITEEQKADSYIATNSNLYGGLTVGSQNIAINAVGIYPRALSAEAIARHFSEARDLPLNSQVIDTFYGDVTPVSINGANVFLDQWWSSEEDWRLGKMDNSSVVNGQLVPQFIADTSVSGSWLDSFSLSQANSNSIYGVNMNWDGEGVTIEVSLDGTTWETAQRGKNVALIPSGFNPTDKVLQVRASFAGGIVNDTSFLDNLNVVGLKAAVTPEALGRTVTYASATPEREYPVIQYNDNWGVQINDGGSIVISADALESTPARTLEMWIKAKNGTAPTFSLSGTTYLNGVADASALNPGAWTLVHIVAAADAAGAITINGPAQVGQVAIYDYALSAQNISDIYAAYVGANAVRVGDNSVVTVSELPTAVKIYAHDWAIQGAG